MTRQLVQKIFFLAFPPKVLRVPLLMALDDPFSFWSGSFTMAREVNSRVIIEMHYTAHV